MSVYFVDICFEVFRMGLDVGGIVNFPDVYSCIGKVLYGIDRDKGITYLSAEKVLCRRLPN